jgi:ABC-type glutathione transport system ATPase component
MPPRRDKKEPSKQDIDPSDLPPRATRPLPIIKVVGISGSGKSTLTRALRAAGYDARSVSQEHSNVPSLWQQFDRPTYLIYLSASLEDQQARRQDVTWSTAAHQEEIRRLAHAREHADLRIDTGKLTAADVYKVALSYLTRQRVRHADQPLPALPATGSATKTPPPDPKA